MDRRDGEAEVTKWIGEPEKPEGDYIWDISPSEDGFEAVWGIRIPPKASPSDTKRPEVPEISGSEQQKLNPVSPGDAQPPNP